MRIGMFYFTEKGAELAVKVKESFSETEIVFFEGREKNRTEKSLSEWVGEAFERRDALLFIGACGIAVRSIARFIQNKLTDSPVLVMDEEGRFVIPVLSGHAGGANELAEKLAKRLGAVLVITTATDLHHSFAADVFAVKNGLSILNKEGIAAVSARVLQGKTLLVAIEENPAVMLINGLKQVEFPLKEPVDLVISTEKDRMGNALLQLKPKEYVIGIGCKKNKSYEEISRFIHSRLASIGITEQDIKSLASIDLKAREEGLLRWKDFHRVPFETYSKQELCQIEGEFQASAFVQDTVGVDNVCERAALAACGKGGRLVLKKQTENGMTLAVAKRKWTLEWIID